MTITDIELIPNPHNKKMKPIKEKQGIYLDVINQNISRRNGMVCVYTGSGGSGKSSLMLNQFKDKNQYKKVFNNIYYFCPSASFNSVDKHPFEKLPNVYHTLDVATLSEIYEELVSKKDDATKKKEKREHNDSSSSSATESSTSLSDIDASSSSSTSTTMSGSSPEGVIKRALGKNSVSETTRELKRIEASEQKKEKKSSSSSSSSSSSDSSSSSKSTNSSSSSSTSSNSSSSVLNLDACCNLAK